MRYIKLSQGLEAIVDDADFESLSAFRWYARKCRKTGKYHAYRLHRLDNGKSKSIEMNRNLLELAPSDKNFYGLHLNEDTLDYRRANLIIVSASKSHAKNALRRPVGYKGAFFRKDRGYWQAQIKIGGKTQSLGIYPTREQAHSAYVYAARLHFGEFARVI